MELHTICCTYGRRMHLQIVIKNINRTIIRVLIGRIIFQSCSRITSSHTISMDRIFFVINEMITLGNFLNIYYKSQIENSLHIFCACLNACLFGLDVHRHSSAIVSNITLKTLATVAIIHLNIKSLSQLTPSFATPMKRANTFHLL